MAQTEFWSAMRSILAVNELTSGVEILDDIEAALISGQADPVMAFSGPINLLPPPSGWRQGFDAPRLLDREEASKHRGWCIWQNAQAPEEAEAHAAEPASHRASSGSSGFHDRL
ncbi:hypothetical protein PF008_g22489 [Phytophthora fragariae]|uniref:Uncharacterized protein n=1 Tax=Phytophthora fragariae TaxID=53985 RepID=A0A6G0QTH8_9STRA|nr:hypothetical protein PF008_g22489 [Phytophthora fragariae]